MTVGAATRPRTPRHRHSPRVRRLAAEAGLDLSTVTGSGASGRVTTDDVRRAVRGAAPAPTAATHTSVVEVDLTDVLAGGDQIPLAAHLAAATVEALGTVPAVHGPAGRPVDLAVTSDERGCVLLERAGDLSVSGITRRLTGADGSADSARATFVLADTRGRGTLWDTPPLPAGQVAALGVGAVVERPAVVRGSDGEPALAIRSIAYLTLGYDPRYVAGADAARFLAAVRQRLEREPRPGLD